MGWLHAGRPSGVPEGLFRAMSGGRFHRGGSVQIDTRCGLVRTEPFGLSYGTLAHGSPREISTVSARGAPTGPFRANEGQALTYFEPLASTVVRRTNGSPLGAPGLNGASES